MGEHRSIPGLDMTYTITKSDGSDLVTLPDLILDNTTTSITLVGKDAVNYGEEFSQNFVDLLQRFSNSSAPVNPLQGQLWFDNESSKLKVFGGNNWKIVSPSFDGYSGTINLPIDSSPQASTSVLIADQSVVSVTTAIDIGSVYLSQNIIVDGITYSFAPFFEDGLQAGINLADSSNGYVFSGCATSGNVLATGRVIRLTGGVNGEVLFDGSGNVNIATAISTVYVGNTNVSIAGIYSNITVSSNGVITTANALSLNDVVGALGYLPFDSANISTNNTGNTLAFRDENGSFSANVMTGTVTYADKFSKNTNISVQGSLVGTSGQFDGTSNLIINSSLANMENLVEGVYNKVTVNNTGLITEGRLVESMPVGSIVLYNNSVVIPEGWATCDGSTVTTPTGATVKTPNLSNVLVGSAFYITKAWSDIYLPSNDTIVGTISINLQKGSIPTVYVVGGPQGSYPPLVWSNVNVGAAGSTVITDLEMSLETVNCTYGGKGYSVGDVLYIEVPNFDPKKSQEASVRVDSVFTGNSGIKTYTLTFPGKYYSVPGSGITGIWINQTNFSQPVEDTSYQGYMPTGKPPKQKAWKGIPGLRKNKPKKKNHVTDPAEFDLVCKTNSNTFFLPDVDFGNNFFFDAVALILTNGDPNAVMLSQTNLYGDLSQLTVVQVMKNLETRIESGLPPRLGKYMLSYDDIVHNAGFLKCPVDLTKFTIAFQNRIMLLVTSENANKFAYAGIFPSDEKLFGAAYIGFDRYLALLRGDKTRKVYEVFNAAGVQRTYLPQIDEMQTQEFLVYISRLITNAKIAISNNRIARVAAELANKSSKTPIPIPEPLIANPLTTTGNASVVLTEIEIDGLPAVVGGNRGDPTYGGGSFIKAGNTTNLTNYVSINNIRYNINGGGGGGGGNVPSNGINPGGGPSYKSGTGTNTGTQTPSVNPGGGTYQTGGGMLGAYAQHESGGNPYRWNDNGARNYKSYYGKAPPDPRNLTVNEVIAEQTKMIAANNPEKNPKAVGNASSALGSIQMTRDTIKACVAGGAISGTDTWNDATDQKCATYTHDTYVKDLAGKLGVSPSQITQGQAAMALSYGPAGAKAVLTAPPGATIQDVLTANPSLKQADLLNNPPCTPQGLNTPANKVEGYCADFHQLPERNAPSLSSQASTNTGQLTNLKNGVSPAQPISATVADYVSTTQTNLTRTVSDINKAGVTPEVADNINGVLGGQGVQAYNSSPSPSTVGRITSITGGYGIQSYGPTPGTVQVQNKQIYDRVPSNEPTAVTGGKGVVAYGGASQKPSSSSGGGGGVNNGGGNSPSKNSSGGVTGGQGVQGTSSGNSNKGTNAAGTGPGNQVGSSGGAGPYSNGGGSGSSFNSGSSGKTTSGGTTSGTTTGKSIGSGCFAAGTLFKMADGSLKAIENITIGDEMLAGGKVKLTFVGDGTGENWFNYNEIVVTGTHPVYDLDGKWRRVGDTISATPVSTIDRYYSLYNEHQRMVAWNDTLFTDFLEVGFDNPLRKTLYGITTGDLIRMLNGDAPADL